MVRATTTGLLGLMITILVPTMVDCFMTTSIGVSFNLVGLLPKSYPISDSTVAPNKPKLSKIIVAVSGMVKVEKFKHLYRVRKLDFALGMVALLGVLTFEETLTGLLVAVVVSLLALVARASQPRLILELRDKAGIPASMAFLQAEGLGK